MQSYDSYDDAAKAVNTAKLNIYRVCKGYKKSSARYQWRESVPGETIIANIETLQIQRPSGEKHIVIQYTIDGNFVREYASVAEAVRITGINAKSIRDAAKGLQKTAGGYCWLYKE